jgi:hypothetical protein
MGQNEMSTLYREPSIDASYQVSIHIYGKPSIKIANFVPIRLQTWPPQAIIIADWWISKNSSPLKPSSHRQLMFLVAITAYASRFHRRRFFRNQLISNKNCLWWPFLPTDQDEMNNLYREPYIDAS